MLSLLFHFVSLIRVRPLQHLLTHALQLQSVCISLRPLFSFLFTAQRDARAGWSHKANQTFGIASLSLHFPVYKGMKNSNPCLAEGLA